MRVNLNKISYNTFKAASSKPVQKAKETSQAKPAATPQVKPEAKPDAKLDTYHLFLKAQGLIDSTIEARLSHNRAGGKTVFQARHLTRGGILSFIKWNW